MHLFMVSFVCLAATAAYASGFPKFPFDLRTTEDGGGAAAGSKCGARGLQWRPNREPRVIGGEVAPPGAVPWQIDLRLQDNTHQCGGALISSRLILTAAHCYSEGLKAVAGAHGPPGSSPYEQVLKVERFLPHPDFRKLGPYSHDLALLLVPEPGFRLNKFISPACLSKDHSASQPGTWCEVSGWGAVDPDDAEVLSPVLKVAAVPVVPLDICRKKTFYGGRTQQILDSMLCAGYLKGGVDACGGDSGGPLMCEQDGRWEVVGIVSWGDGCAKKNKPGVYTRVSSFDGWIKQSAREMAYNVALELGND
nr:unnamed protein product [Callosobruchus analis]